MKKMSTIKRKPYFAFLKRIEKSDSLARVGFIITIVSMVFGFATWGYSEWKEAKQNRQWAPARKAVLIEVANTYSSIFYAARNIPAPENNIATDIPSSIYYQSERVLLDRSKIFLKKLQESIKLNNTALDSELLPQLTAFVSNAEKLNALLEYFAEFQNPTFASYDFVSEGPSHLLNELADGLAEMHKQFPDTLIPNKDLPGNLMTVDELDVLWTTFETKCQRLSFHPKQYVWHDSTPVAVFNLQTLRELNPPNEAQSKNGVKVFFGYQ
jgi:hypothetical protein